VVDELVLVQTPTTLTQNLVQEPANAFLALIIAASPDLDAFVVESCTVRVPSRRSMTVGLDGELIRVPLPLEFRLARDSLRVVGARPPAAEPGGGTG